MEREMGIISRIGTLSCEPSRLIRKLIFNVLKVGPIPNHIAFIMDGNRRYAKKKKLKDVMEGHEAGCLALMSIFVYCYELGVKYVTAYAFSIDNFKRRPEEVQKLMDLMMQKIQLLTTIVISFGVRVHFSGNLELLNSDVRGAAKKLMQDTCDNSNAVLTICVAYTSTDEIVHAIQQSCCESYEDRDDHIKKCNGDCYYNNKKKKKKINLVELETNMYMAMTPCPDILIRTGGEDRLSNFLLWQTPCTLLSAMVSLWPEISLWNLVWAVLNFQRNHPYLEKKKKLLSHN